MINEAIRQKLRQNTTTTLRFGTYAVQHAEDSLWNAAGPIQVQAVVECAVTADVQHSIRVAADHGLPVAVLAGGHDWAGRACSPGGITLDLRQMNRVTYNDEEETATIEGGALISGVLDALPDDRAVVAGTISTVGMAGLTLGGGYGKLNSRFGLSCDTLLRADVVLADGTVAVASEQDDAELFWALRGGGGNFGVVTSMTMTAHRLPKVLTGLFFVPLAAAAEGLLGIQTMLDDHGDYLSIFSALMTGPSGDRGLILGPLWSGEEAAGERAFETISRMLGAQGIAQGWSPYKGTYSKEFEAGWPKGRGYVMDAVNLARLDKATAEILVECARLLPTDADCIMLHDFHGACARVGPDDTAFSLRGNHFNAQLLASWPKGHEADASRAWIKATQLALAPVSFRGGYPNILGSDFESRSRAHRFYADAVGRLSTVKQHYDPADLFRSNTGHL